MQESFGDNNICPIRSPETNVFLPIHNEGLLQVTYFITQLAKNRLKEEKLCNRIEGLGQD